MKYSADGDATDKRKRKKPSIAQAVVVALLVMGAFLVVSRDAYLLLSRWSTIMLLRRARM